MNQEEIRALEHAGLTPAQREFIESTAKHTMIAGGMGAGKAFILRKAIIELALHNPEIRIAVFSKDMYRLNENIGKHILYGGISELKWPKGMTVQNGSSIYFLAGKTIKDIQRYAGMEFEIIAVYEAQDLKEEEYNFLQTMNRTSRAGGVPRMIYIASPGGSGHQWIKRLFIDRKYKQGERPQDYHFIKATINQSLFEEANTAAQKELKALLEAEWDPTGKIEEPICHVGKEQYEYLLQLRDKGAKYLWMNALENMFATSEIPVFDGPPSFSLRSVILGVSIEGPFGGYFEPFETMNIEEQICAYERDNNIKPTRAGEGAE